MTSPTIRLGDKIIDVNASLIALDRVECKESLAAFIKLAWHIIEPGQFYVHGWHIDALCEHLEAITDGVKTPAGIYNRLLVNIPPGTAKSLVVSVFWPAWEWGPMNMPHLRYVCASHSQDLAVRDSMRMRRLVTSEWYQARWPHVKLVHDQNSKLKFETTATGFRQAAAAGSITGSRGDRVILDDPHSVDGANSDQMRQSTIQWFLEAVPTRLNNPATSAIVVIMQRLHEGDVSGVILEKDIGYDHLMLPMRYDPARAVPTMIGFEDPRQEEGELLFPQRFPDDVVDRDERVLGPYATAGQFQQEPAPRGGGIIKRDYWQLWESDIYPTCDLILASLDTAYTTKQENDYSALTVWGVFTGAKGETANRYVDRTGISRDGTAQSVMFDQGVHIRTGMDLSGSLSPRVIMMHAWQEKLELHDLVVKVGETCRRMRVDKLIIEDKAAGHSVAQELQRLYGSAEFGVQLINPGAIDKLARLHSIEPIFAEGMVYAPDRSWADTVITQTATFPKAKNDDLVDTVSQAIRHLRDIGLLARSVEVEEDLTRSMTHHGKAPAALYPV
jgi:predicted phage terminase large subunit-like protein